MHEYPTLREVLAMHEILLAEFGGADGIRDLGALESALMRPQLGYYETLIDEDAVNKRVAFFTTDTFLRMNGHFVDCDSEAAYRFFMALFDANEFRFAALREWLLDHVLEQ